MKTKRTMLFTSRWSYMKDSDMEDVFYDDGTYEYKSVKSSDIPLTVNRWFAINGEIKVTSGFNEKTLILVCEEIENSYQEHLVRKLIEE